MEALKNLRKYYETELDRLLIEHQIAPQKLVELNALMSAEFDQVKNRVKSTREAALVIERLFAEYFPGHVPVSLQ